MSRHFRKKPLDPGDLVLLGMGLACLPLLLWFVVYEPRPVRVLIIAWFLVGVFVAVSYHERYFVCRRDIWKVVNALDPRVQAWSVVFGDTLALPFALATMAHARATTDAGDIRPWSWVAVALWIVLSVMVGLAFHEMDRKAYVAESFGGYVDCSSKLFHDLVMTPVLFTAMVVGGVPLLWTWPWNWHWTPHTVTILVAVVAWLIPNIRDQRRGRKPFYHVNVLNEPNPEPVPAD